MKKYRHKITGAIATGEQVKNQTIYSFDAGGLISHHLPAVFVENSNDWEEIKEYPAGTIIRDTRSIAQEATYIKEQDGFWYRNNIYHQRITWTTDEIEKEIGQRFQLTSKVVEMNEHDQWTILSFNVHNTIFTLNSKGRYSSRPELTGSGLEAIIGIFPVHSVLIKPTNTVLTIGDKIQHNTEGSHLNGVIQTIKGFHHNEKGNLCVDTDKTNKNGLYILNNIVKVVPMLVTEDGVELFPGDQRTIYWLGSGNQVVPIMACNHWLHDSAKFYADKRKTQEYVVMNANTLSINDFKSLMRGRDFVGSGYILDKAIELVKEKIST